ncbi:unnamed protein product [Parnassius apollo]|uniref:(apollo) hypothetical protein n=1 Tax=Parnassius apollo TaxID=110799 RepID=A0A8S3W1B3_PARAO|nr:unnamed protein product [Parnassius apollo]
MSVDCWAFGVQVPDGCYIKCSKKQCEKVYDLKCLGLTENKFSSFSDKRTKQWVCPECACSKPKRYDPNTPIRDTPDLKTFTPSANVNTQRGSRMQLMDESIVECDNNSNDKLLSEFRQLKYEVLSRLDVQTYIIKHLQEICFSTKTELEELKIKMKVFQNKLFPTDLLSTQNQQFESIDSITESLNTGLEMSKQIDVPSTFADVARISLNNVNKTNVTPCVIKTPAAMKIATGRGSVVQTQPINQPQCVTPKKELNINISEEEEKINKDCEWTIVRKKRGSYQSKNVKKGNNTVLLDIQATY